MDGARICFKKKFRIYPFPKIKHLHSDSIRTKSSQFKFPGRLENFDLWTFITNIITFDCCASPLPVFVKPRNLSFSNQVTFVWNAAYCKSWFRETVSHPEHTYHNVKSFLMCVCCGLLFHFENSCQVECHLNWFCFQLSACVNLKWRQWNGCCRWCCHHLLIFGENFACIIELCIDVR